MTPTNAPAAGEKSSAQHEEETGSTSSNVPAAYQVTARLLAAEQATVWSRTQGFFALNGLVVTLGSRLTGTAQVVLTLIGIVLTSLFWSSLKRSWGYRKVFASTLRAQELDLKLGTLGPMTQGYAASVGSVSVDGKELTIGGRTQNEMSVAFVIVVYVFYAALLANGLGLASVFKTG